MLPYMADALRPWTPYITAQDLIRDGENIVRIKKKQTIGIVWQALV